MNHFEREAYIQWLMAGLPLAIGFVSTLIGLIVFSSIDAVRASRCLDAHHGSEGRECDRRPAE